MKQLFAISLALALGYSPFVRAEVAVGQNEKYVTVEASETDCRIEGRMWEFLEAANKLADIVIGFHQKFKGTPWDDLTEANDTEIREAILAATRDFYENKIKEAKKEKPVFNDPRFPAPTRITGDLNFSLEHVRPAAIFFVITLKSWGATENVKLAKEVAEATKDAVRGGFAGMLDPKAGGSVQLGVVATPMCSWTMAKDPSVKHLAAENNSKVLNGDHWQKEYAAKTPGEFKRGWGEISGFDFEPLVILNVSGGVGKEFVSSSKSKIAQALDRWKPTIGLVWGDVNYAREVSGGYGAININTGIRAPMGRKGADGKRALVTLGVNDKWGCINNPSKSGPLPVPYCDDFFFKSWRFAQPSDERLKDNGFSWAVTASKKVSVGGMLAGVSALRWILSTFGIPPEEQDEYLTKWDWLIDRSKRYLPNESANELSLPPLDRDAILRRGGTPPATEPPPAAPLGPEPGSGLPPQ